MFLELTLSALQRTEEIFRDIVAEFGTRYLCAGGLLNSLNSDLADDEEYADIKFRLHRSFGQPGLVGEAENVNGFTFRRSYSVSSVEIRTPIVLRGSGVRPFF